MASVLVADIEDEDDDVPDAVAEYQMLRATRASDVVRLSKAIVRVVTKPEVKHVDLRAIGAAAVNQAAKSVVMANTRLASRGLYCVMVPRFETVDGDRSNEISALTFRLILKEIG